MSARASQSLLQVAIIVIAIAIAIAIVFICHGSHFNSCDAIAAKQTCYMVMLRFILMMVQQQILQL